MVFTPARRFRLSVAFATFAAAGCSSIFGIDDPKPAPPKGVQGGSAPYSGGAGGEGGELSGTGGSSVTGGATGTTQGGSGSGAQGGTSQAGKGGKGGAGDSGGTSAGVPGDGGGGGEVEPPDEWPTPGMPCPTLGEFACPGPAAGQSLVCDGTWRVSHACSEFTRCDRRSGTCSEKRCMTEGEPYCNGEYAVRCGPDLTTFTEERCLLGCDANSGVCIAPLGDQLIIDGPPPIQSDRPIWPDPIIPVCVHGAAAHLAESRAVRNELERTWGRHAGVALPGWNECGTAPVGIELEFVENCDGELGGVERYGYPGPAASTRIRLCLSYYDPRRALVRTAEPLLRYVARHELGHVLGLEDGGYDPLNPHHMSPVVHTSSAYQNVGIPYYDLVWLQTRYGRKPSHSLVTSEGACLSQSFGLFQTASCVGEPEQAFQPEAGRLEHVESGSCVRAGATPGSIVSGDCAFGSTTEPAVVWEPRGVQWIGFANRCVALRTNRTQEPGAEFAVEPCDATKPEQRFDFEFLPSGGVRIRRSATGECLTAPDPWPSGFNLPYPVLTSSCGYPRDRFEAGEGQLSVDRRCLAAAERSATLTVVQFRACGDYYYHRWKLTGAFRNAAGDALTVSSAPGPLLVAAAVVGAPAANQIFDYHF